MTPSSRNDQYTAQSPPTREPLLAGAQVPGISSRLSDPSMGSYDHTAYNNMGMGNTYPSYSSTASSFSPLPSQSNLPRYGPTASISPSSSSNNHTSSGSGTGTGTPLLGSSIIPGSGSGKGFSPLSNGMEEDDDLDDHLHTFTSKEKIDLTSPFNITSMRGWANGLTLLFLLVAVVMLFAGYPIIAYTTSNKNGVGANTPGYNLGGINSTGQVPLITGLPQLIDPDTPSSAMTRTGYDGNQWKLVFSDEFNKEGRSFYDGDDPFWEAVDLWYWPTQYVGVIFPPGLLTSPTFYLSNLPASYRTQSS